MKHHPGNDRKALGRQAVALLETHFEEGPDSAECEAFRAQSADHARALDDAQRFLAAARGVAPRRFSARERIRKRLQLWWVFSTQPVIALPALAVLLVAGFFVATTGGVPTSTGLDATPAIASPSAGGAPVREQHETRWQEHREVVLADGSRVWLDWKTSLSAEFDASSRRIVLSRGVAAFDVVSDPERPFFVEANGLAVRVTGTEFVVRAVVADRVEVSVIEGSVLVRLDDTEQRLGPEDHVELRDGALGSVVRRSVDEMGQWREGMLVFRDRPLVEVLEGVARYVPYDLDLARIQEDDRRVSGAYFRDDAERVLTALIRMHRLDAQRVDGSLRVRARPPERPVF
ncbi:MAG: FecR domain-containing protein [Myxococcota bacterium]